MERVHDFVERENAINNRPQPVHGDGRDEVGDLALDLVEIDVGADRVLDANVLRVRAWSPRRWGAGGARASRPNAEWRASDERKLTLMQINRGASGASYKSPPASLNEDTRRRSLNIFDSRQWLGTISITMGFSNAMRSSSAAASSGTSRIHCSTQRVVTRLPLGSVRTSSRKSQARATAELTRASIFRLASRGTPGGTTKSVIGRKGAPRTPSMFVFSAANSRR